MYTAEITYGLVIGFSIFVLLTAYFEKLRISFALLFILLSIGIAWLIAPFTMLIITPLSNAIWYGYSWGLFEMFALYHLITLIIMPIIATYILVKTGGKALWE